jgi:hypothetical protein
MSLRDVLRDAVARVIAICEALEFGDIDLAADIARDLELDLVSAMLDDAAGRAA